MSRVDEALRRAALEGPSVHSPTAVEPSAVAADARALESYVLERGHAERPRSSDRGPAPAAAAPASPARHQDRMPRYHASLEGKVICSRETSAVSVEQYRRLAASLLAIQAERGL